jgi:hypothetical protein
MATIPTYDSQVTQVVAQKDFHVDSTASAVATGVVQGISDAAKIASSVGEVSYDLNSAERAQRIKDDGFKLEQANAEIKQKHANNPNYEEVNKELENVYNEALNNAPDLDEKSVQEWRKAMLGEFDSMRRNNIKWGVKASATAGKKAAEQANLELYDRMKSNANRAGLERVGYSAGSLDINESGQKTEYHVPAMNTKDRAIQEDLNSEYFIGMAQAPLQTDENDPAISGILGDNLDELEGEEKQGWWIFGKKGKTKQEIGEEKIKQYFDDVRNNIDSSDLPKARKEALTDYATSQENARKREFNAFIRGTNLENQKALAGIDISAVPRYFENLEKQQEQDNLLELNITPTTTVSDEYASDYLANLTFGSDYTSPSTYFEYAPMGLVKDFNVDLHTALETLNIPVGQWALKDLYQKYAPNGTVNEIQAVESLVSMNPNIELVGDEIDQFKPENGFAETDWAYATIADISEMPDSSNEEQQRKQAAINHAVFQANKEINGGKGFIDKNLRDNFETYLKDSDAGIAMIYNSPAIIQQIGALVNEIKDTGDMPLFKRASSIVNQGIKSATEQYRQDNDKSAFARNVKKVNQEVLAMRYAGVFDINDMQTKLENKQPALFTYNGRPYEYLGFSGQEIYVRVGNKKTTLGA